MIDQQTLKTLHEEGLKAALDFRLIESLQYATALANESTNTVLQNKLDEIRSSYDSMLDFLGLGIKDEKRNEIQEDLARKLIDILNNAHRQVRINLSKDIFSKTYWNIPQTLGDIHDVDYNKELMHRWSQEQVTMERFETQDLMFDLLWTQGKLTSRQMGDWFEFISLQTAPVQQHLTAALFMGCWEYWDEARFTLIRMLTESESPEVRANALISFSLLCIRYQSYAHLYAELKERLSKKASSEMAKVQRCLFLTKQTKDVQKALTEKAFPQWAKAMNDFDESEASKAKYKKIAEDSINKWVECGRDGIDINHGTIFMVRGDKFFQRVARWLAPFEEERPEIMEQLYSEEGKRLKLKGCMIRAIANTSDSDAYAFTLMLKENDANFEKLESQLDEITEDQLIPPDPYLMFARDLIRLFTLSSWKKELRNPYEESIYMMDCPLLRDYITNPDKEGLIMMMIKYQGEAKALSYIEDVLHEQGATADLLKCKGLCHEKTGNYPAAVQAFSQADLLQEDDIDLLAHLADCLGHLERHDEELECVERMLKLDPEDNKKKQTKVLLLLKLYRTDEAIKLLQQYIYEGIYEIENLENIAICYYQKQLYDNALKYMEKLFAKPEFKPNWRVYLHAGHYAFHAGDWTRAIEYYQKYLELYRKATPDDKTGGFEPFDKEKRIMNVNPKDWQLMRDILQKPILGQ